MMSLDAELLEKGYLDLNDPDIGRLVGEMEGLSLLSLFGLDFLKLILHNPVREDERFR
jgi:hypothetical protein